MDFFFLFFFFEFPFFFYIFPSPYLCSYLACYPRRKGNGIHPILDEFRCQLVRREKFVSSLFVLVQEHVRDMQANVHAQVRCVLKHPIRSCECSYFDFVYSIEQTKGGGAKLESCAWDKRKQELNVNGVMTLTFG